MLWGVGDGGRFLWRFGGLCRGLGEGGARLDRGTLFGGCHGDELHGRKDRAMGGLLSLRGGQGASAF